MRSNDDIAVLIVELENDLSYIHEGYATRNRALLRMGNGGWGDEFAVMALGTCLHGLYNAFESYFVRVAKFFENSIEQAAWYRDLLDRMTLSVPGLRQALITDRDLLERLDELRRFRHLFRNLYKSRLHPDKLRIVNEATEGIVALFEIAHQEFVRWLAELAEATGTVGH